MNLSRIARTCIGAGVLLSVAGVWGVESLLRPRAGDQTPAAVAGSSRSETRSLGEFDAGILVSSAVVEHEFVLTNDSSEPWKVYRAWVDCGCLSLQQTEFEPVPPGAALKLRVRLDTDGRSGGALSERVHVLLDSGEHLIGRVRARCVLAPHADPPVMRASVSTEDSHFFAECRLMLPAPNSSVRAVVGEVPEGLQVEMYEEAERGPDGGRVYAVHVQGLLPVDTRSQLFAVPVHVLGLEGIPGAGGRVWLKCSVERAVDLDYSPRLVLLEGGSTLAQGYVALRDSAGGKPQVLDVEVVPEGAVECSYEAASGRLHVRGAPHAPDGVVLRVTTQEGHRAEIPVAWN